MHIIYIPTLVQQTPATAHRAWQPVRVLILPVFRLLQAPKRPPLSVTAKKWAWRHSGPEGPRRSHLASCASQTASIEQQAPGEALHWQTKRETGEESSFTFLGLFILERVTPPTRQAFQRSSGPNTPGARQPQRETSRRSFLKT